MPRFRGALAIVALASTSRVSVPPGTRKALGDPPLVGDKEHDARRPGPQSEDQDPQRQADDGARQQVGEEVAALVHIG